MRLRDKVAFITGAGRGIGQEIAATFYAEGAAVILNDIEGPLVEAALKRMNIPEDKGLALPGDVAEVEDVRRIMGRIRSTYGRIDILVNNAGIRKDVVFPDMTEKDWDLVMSVQLKGTFNCCRTAVPPMIEQRSGIILNISSPVPAALGKSGQVNYASASAGLEGFTRALALELGPYNIRVNCISPDYIYTEMTRNAALKEGFYFQDLQKFVVADIPLKRLGTTADVAKVALFFASEESAFVTGQVLYVRGGP